LAIVYLYACFDKFAAQKVKKIELFFSAQNKVERTTLIT